MTLQSHPYVGDIRIFGFAAGIELVEDKETKNPLAPQLVANVLLMCKQRGLIIGKNGDTSPGFSNVLTISPPFITTFEEVDWIVSTIEIALNSLPIADVS